MKTKVIQLPETNNYNTNTIASLVQIACEFGSNINLEYSGRKINAKSIMGMMTLQLGPGASLMVSADGTDETEAIEKICRKISGTE
ncbi:MAG: HPr family phosphocarrier protein [Lachnospiraceae bacterium]|jgi:phosphocarrier protein HPr|nr:HPr family phosphocarrier protein [Lachnospiraceae bacterium]MDD3616975.1 HPr family phosphocarrier protein [Lachnospiraceae bacterium]